MAKGIPPDSIAKPIVSTSDPLVDEIVTFFSADSRHDVCPLGNEYIDSTDAVSTNYPARAVYRGELYHLMRSGIARSQLADILRVAKSVPVFIGVLSTLERFINILGEVISDAVFYDIVRNVEAIIVGAFDGEGFVVWRRTQESSQLVIVPPAD